MCWVRDPPFNTPDWDNFCLQTKPGRLCWPTPTRPRRCWSVVSDPPFSQTAGLWPPSYFSGSQSNRGHGTLTNFAQGRILILPYLGYRFCQTFASIISFYSSLGTVWGGTEWWLPWCRLWKTKVGLTTFQWDRTRDTSFDYLVPNWSLFILHFPDPPSVLAYVAEYETDTHGLDVLRSALNYDVSFLIHTLSYF